MRKQSWPSELDKTIRKYQKRKFACGKYDCALFASDCVLAMTGEDYAADFRGKYSTRRGAIQILKKLGYGDLYGVPEKHLKPIPLASVKRGDVVGYSDALGICNGRLSFFFDVSGILKTIKTSACHRAWGVD